MIMDYYQSEHLELFIPSPFLTAPAFPPQQPSHTLITHTQNNINTDKHITLTTIVFGNAQNQKEKLKKKKEGQRRGLNCGKQSIKRLQNGWNSTARKQKINTKKQNIFSKTELQEKIKQSEARVLSKMHSLCPSQMLQIRSIQLDQQLQQLHTRKQPTTGSIQKQLHLIKPQPSSVKATESDGIIAAKAIHSVPEKSADQLFREVKRKLQGQKQLADSNRKGKNGFYSNLKRKLQLEIKHIEDKNRRESTNLLIQGCHIHKHIRGERQPFKSSITDRTRPQTAMTRTGLELRSCDAKNQDKRPNSCRSRNLQRKQIEYLSQKSNDIFVSRVRACHSNRSSVSKENTDRSRRCKSKQNWTERQPTNAKTLRHVSPIYKNRNGSASKSEVEKEKIKQKMLSILVDCHGQTEEMNQLQEGLKVFEFYCKKMQNGMEKASRVLREVQNSSYDDQFI